MRIKHVWSVLDNIFSIYPSIHCSLSSPLRSQIITHQQTPPDGHLAAGLSCHIVLGGGVSMRAISLNIGGRSRRS